MQVPAELAHVALVADELPVAIWMGRVPSGEAVYTNAAFREVLGIEPPTGAARGAFVAPYGVHTASGAPYPEDQMPFERVLAARTTVVVDDLVIHRRDGRRVNLRVFAKPIFDAQGTMTHVLEAFTDISHEVAVERARAEGERRLARSQRLEAIGQLVAGIAHDFNNLLTVTKLALSTLLARETDETKVESLEQIGAVTNSAVDLIRSLIEFARRERQIAAPMLLEGAVRPVLDMAARTFDPAVVLRSDLDAAGAMVLADPSQVEQVLMNLVINARDAVSGRGEVVVRTTTWDIAQADAGTLPAGRYVVLEVTDTGSGIDPAIRDRIFEPYFTTKMQGTVKGTGLGLSTVHGIVEALGGCIDVDDNEGGGTVMRVMLPRAPDEALPASDQGLVLVVDDEPLVRASMKRTLEARGFRVVTAADGATAIEIFAARHREVAAVVLDMVMPGLRGQDVYLELRKVRADVAVLLVTGSALDDEARAILALGVRACLPKPYDTEALLAALTSVRNGAGANG